MGISNKDNSNHNMNQNGSNNTAYQDNSIRITYGGDGRTCPFGWVISNGTCGICNKLYTCKDGREWQRSLLNGMSDY